MRDDLNFLNNKNALIEMSQTPWEMVEFSSKLAYRLGCILSDADSEITVGTPLYTTGYLLFKYKFIQVSPKCIVFGLRNILLITRPPTQLNHSFFKIRRQMPLIIMCKTY